MKIDFITTKISARTEYVVNLLSERLGIEFIIKNYGENEEYSEPALAYLPADIISGLSDQKLLAILDSENIEKPGSLETEITSAVFYGQSLPILGRFINKHGEWKKIRGKHLFRSNNLQIIPFDLVANIFYHLSRIEERHRIFAEETPADVQKSILMKYGQLEIPVADILQKFLEDSLQELFSAQNKLFVRIENWPEGQQYGLALTHDVDITRGVGYKTKMLNLAKKTILNLWGQKDKARNISEKENKLEAQAWTYPELLKSYLPHKIKTTFFFISKMTEGLSLRYDIAEPKFRKLFEQLNESGHEIALHPSFYAFEKPSQYFNEKNKLKACSGKKAVGMRQHYLRAKFPRLWRLAKSAGFGYDSSLGYNHSAGFRAGTCMPFPVFDYEAGRAYELYEFPLIFFEYSLPAQGLKPELSNHKIKKLLKQIREVKGLMVALLHPHNFNKEPYRGYWSLLIQLVKSENVFASSLEGLLDWQKSRAQIKIIQQVSDSQKAIFKINKPDAVDSFAIKINRSGQFEKKRGVNVQPAVDSDCYVISSKLKNFSLTFLPEL